MKTIKTKHSKYFHMLLSQIFLLLITAICILSTSSQILGQNKIFTKITSQLNPSASAGCGWIDYNSDNKLDAYVTFFNTAPLLFPNGGDTVFSKITTGSSLPLSNNCSGICWGDYDNNGFEDLYVTNMSGGNFLYKNYGDGNFERVTTSGTTGLTGSFLAANWIDYDSDGNLDLFVNACGTSFNQGTGNLNFLLRNNGDMTFTRVKDNALASQNTYSSSAAFADYDNDGDMDVFLTEWSKDNWLFENNGDGTFKKITGTTVNSNSNVSISASWADYDNDGYMDLFVGNGSTSATVKQHNYLFHNNGDKTFTKVTEGDVANYNGCVWTSAWGDVNNDGYLDLYAGTIYEKEDQLYINNGDGTFTVTHEFDSVKTAGGTGITGASFGDFDNDGFLDLVTADATNTNYQFIYHNNGNSNHWINIKCEGTISNKSAIGARVKIKATISGKTFWQMREITGVQGFRGCNDLRAHFGLGDADKIDSLIIDWPSKQRTIQTNIEVNQFLKIKETVPLNYLKPSFRANMISGYSPLQVQFTDISICDDTNPITKWSWDLDGDGKEDSDEQNPSITYDNYNGDTLTVSLTVSNGIKTETVVRENYIELMPAYKENLGYNKKITASSYISSDRFPGSNAVDNNTRTYWQSAASTTAEWIQADLGTEYLIGKITVQWGTFYAKKYTIQSSLDGTNWKDLSSVNKQDGTADEISINTEKARYMKLKLEQSSSATQGFRINEIGFYRPVTTGVEEERERLAPAEYKLFQNYPNPFNPETTISFSVQGSGMINLEIFNILGEKVKTLVNEFKNAGTYSAIWNGMNDQGFSVCSGVYFSKLTLNTQKDHFSSTIKMLLLK